MWRIDFALDQRNSTQALSGRTTLKDRFDEKLRRNLGVIGKAFGANPLNL
jgi:hypothetical protein